ncbi:MAG: hypothetical protein DRJ42_25600 [Deltaproteobacteria bacterium]|nr:MAG: hypothetical protein DRJ42_25600 [Deltaproteobacteria bacterium]
MEERWLGGAAEVRLEHLDNLIDREPLIPSELHPARGEREFGSVFKPNDWAVEIPSEELALGRQVLLE